MEKTPRLSVIIAAYNAADTLGETLDSLREQEYAGSWEVIVADNRSSDGTADVVRRYQAQMPNLRLLPAHDRQGKCYATNLAAKHARGAVFLFVDADDTVAPGWLAAMAAATAEHHAVAGSIDTKTLNQHTVHRPISYRGVEHKALGFLPYLLGGNCGISREAWEAVGGNDERFPGSHDLELSWRLQLAGYRLHYAPEAVLRYRHRGTLRDLWRQISRYAHDYPLLYKEYKAHGMPRATPAAVLKKYWWLLRTAYYPVRGGPGRRAKWLYEAAYAWGLVRGSLDHRELYL
jgi:glycosyltransferase involved in cell wall biosynthesis